MTHTRNKQIKGAYAQYLNSHFYNLSDIYTTYSCNKVRALNYCKNLEKSYNAKCSGKIISHNLMTFSYGFIGEIVDNKTGEIKDAFFYITRDYHRYIYLDELC